MTKFRFQDLEIWKFAIEIADELFDIADELERRRLYRFAEQLRAAGMSMSNNISEGSGSSSKKEFNQFLISLRGLHLKMQIYSYFSTDEKLSQTASWKTFKRNSI